MDGTGWTYDGDGALDYDCGEVTLSCLAQARADREIGGTERGRVYPGDHKIQLRPCDLAIAKADDLLDLVGELPLVTNCATHWEIHEHLLQRLPEAEKKRERALVWRVLGVCGEDSEPGGRPGKPLRLQVLGGTDLHLPQLSSAPQAHWAHRNMYLHAHLPSQRELAERKDAPGEPSRVLITPDYLVAAAEKLGWGYLGSPVARHRAADFRAKIAGWRGRGVPDHWQGGGDIEGDARRRARDLFGLVNEAARQYLQLAACHEERNQFVGRCIRAAPLGEKARVLLT